MPLVTWDKATYDAMYDIGAEPFGWPGTRNEIRLHYHRAVVLPLAQLNKDALVGRLGVTLGQNVVVVGCGFGWTVELLNAAGFTCVGTDVSQYIQDNKSTTEDADLVQAVAAAGLDYLVGDGATAFARLRGDGVRTRATVLNESAQTQASRNSIKAAVGNRVDVVITEDVLTSLTDAECAQLSTALNKLTAEVYHLVTTNAGPPFNGKTLEGWKALLPSDTFAAINEDYRVL